jgi:uncharacterized membrane protein
MVTLDELAPLLLRKTAADLTAQERSTLEAIIAREPISQHAGHVADASETFGDRLADRVAQVGGSWVFISGFALVLLFWMALNSGILPRFTTAFDPYPYIFLNLMLSTLAAIQAPVIMMSQNRKDDRDRLTANLDYEVNLRAELEIMQIHRKLDEAVLAKLDRIELTLAAMQAERAG